MRKSALITQSNYIPWKGYFDSINLVDELILLDDVQYTRRDWRNRNRIKTPQGVRWLTIPVQVKGRFHQRICETRVTRPDWGQRHFSTLQCCYGRTKYFRAYEPLLQTLYLGEQSEFLTEINLRFINAICNLLGITTVIRSSLEFDQCEGRNDRLLAICRKAGITDYYSGKAAMAYLDESKFRSSGVAVHWLDYGGYREYPQPHGPFEHAVTILDLLFNTGPDARSYMKTFSESVLAGGAGSMRHVAP
jgi:hypothetical protein